MPRECKVTTGPAAREACPDASFCLGTDYTGHDTWTLAPENAASGADAGQRAPVRDEVRLAVGQGIGALFVGKPSQEGSTP